MSEHKILYIKGEKNVEVSQRDVYLKDILEMEYPDPKVLNRIKVMKLFKIPEDRTMRYVVSSLKIMERIHKEYPDLQIENEGEQDMIISYKESEQNRKMEWVKVILVTGLSFFGAAFSMMSFHNDVSIEKMFEEIYRLVLGHERQGFPVLEISYSAGIVIGILGFFNHIGRKRFTSDPTPMEVEMRQYEKEIQDTLIESYSRKGKEWHVD